MSQRGPGWLAPLTSPASRRLAIERYKGALMHSIALDTRDAVVYPVAVAILSKQTKRRML
jgi:hypothetical protein